MIPLKTRGNPQPRREKRKITQTSFYTKPTGVNASFERISFGGPGISLCGPHIPFGNTKRSIELENEEFEDNEI